MERRHPLDNPEDATTHLTVPLRLDVEVIPLRSNNVTGPVLVIKGRSSSDDMYRFDCKWPEQRSNAGAISLGTSTGNVGNWVIRGQTGAEICADWVRNGLSKAEEFLLK